MDDEAIQLFVQPAAWEQMKEVIATHLPEARITGPYDGELDDEQQWYALVIPLKSDPNLVITTGIVYAALPADGTPIRAIDLAGVLGYQFGAEPASTQTRQCLQTLAVQGKAQVIYGSGWRRLPVTE